MKDNLKKNTTYFLFKTMDIPVQSPGVNQLTSYSNVPFLQ